MKGEPLEDAVGEESSASASCVVVGSGRDGGWVEISGALSRMTSSAFLLLRSSKKSASSITLLLLMLSMLLLVLSVMLLALLRVSLEPK